MVTKLEKCLTVSLAIHLGERSAGELFLDWSQAERDGFSEVSLGSSEEKNAERAGLVVEADSGWAGVEGDDRARLSWADFSFTEPCQDHIIDKLCSLCSARARAVTNFTLYTHQHSAPCCPI